jgi:hypothetical protein
MTKPRLLDLFCGAGGATIGYQRAGFEVTGVDIRPQPGYPGTFVQADALDYLGDLVPGSFDVIHASPPCQSYSSHVSSRSSQWAGTLGKDEPAMIVPVRLLARYARPTIGWVIENVVGARDELRGPILLCGTMFDLPIPRHRLFEVHPRMAAFDTPSHPACQGVAKRYALSRGWDPRDMTVTGKGRNAGTKDRWMEVMDWPDVPVTQHGLREALPPAYTAWIGASLLSARERVA